MEMESTEMQKNFNLTILAYLEIQLYQLLMTIK